jgi:hypothetical protein
MDQPCTCVLCAKAPPGRDAGIVGAVEKHGWCVLRVGGRIEFAYTVGLTHSFGLPEIVMFGLGGQNMQHWLNTCVDIVRERGLPDAGAPFPGVIDGVDTQLRPVDGSWWDALFGTAHRFYRGMPVPVRQLVWPDGAGRWPWDEAATESSRTRQAFAWLPVDAHPPGGWRLVGTFGDGFPLPAQPDSWALTTRSIVDGGAAPTTVFLDDDVCDVLDARGHDADDLCVALLGDLVLTHPTLRDVGELRAGGVAVRGGDGTWSSSAASGRQRAASAAAWERAQG